MLTLLLTSTLSYSIIFIYLHQASSPSQNKPFPVPSLNDGRDAIYALPSVPAPCQIFTYSQFLPSMGDSTIAQIVELWSYAFYAQGFFPVILNHTSAEVRYNFNETRSKFSIFPSVNHADYELSCYLRWIALAERGGGLLMDYDLLPMTSPRSTAMRALKECRWTNLTTYEMQTPMVLHGSGSEIEKWVNYMTHFQMKDIVAIEGKPHISDMIMALHSISHNEKIFILKPALPFFHYSHAARRAMFDRLKRNITEVFIFENRTMIVEIQRINYHLLFSNFVDHES